MYAIRQCNEVKCSLKRNIPSCKLVNSEIRGYILWKSATRQPPQPLLPRFFSSIEKRQASVLYPHNYISQRNNDKENCIFHYGLLWKWRPSFATRLQHQKRFISINEVLLQMRKSNDEQNLVQAKENQQGQLTVGQKVKQAGKDASYMGVLLIGFGITGVLIWYVLSELLFSFSPNSVYSKALRIVKQNSSVLYSIGEPIKAYGEETSRGRRRHVSHQEYVVDGVNYMRVKFYVAGSKRKGTVHVDTKETSRGNFEFRYIFVELEGHPIETIVVEDNR